MLVAIMAKDELAGAAGQRVALDKKRGLTRLMAAKEGA